MPLQRNGKILSERTADDLQLLLKRICRLEPIPRGPSRQPRSVSCKLLGSTSAALSPRSAHEIRDGTRCRVGSPTSLDSSSRPVQRTGPEQAEWLKASGFQKLVGLILFGPPSARRKLLSCFPSSAARSSSTKQSRWFMHPRPSGSKQSSSSLKEA